jgi:hypothetical protein
VVIQTLVQRRPRPVPTVAPQRTGEEAIHA